MIALIDENISYKIADALRILDCDAHHVTEQSGDYPGPAAEDTAIFQWLGAKGPDWVFITQDVTQTIRLRELNQMRSHRLGVFLLTAKKRQQLTLHEMACAILSHWSKFALINKTETRPYVYDFSATNNIRPHKF